MKIKRIEHVGVVVRDVHASRRLWEDCFGIKLGGVEQIAGRPNKLALYPVGCAYQRHRPILQVGQRPFAISS